MPSATSVAVSAVGANAHGGGFGNSQSIKRGMDDYILSLDGTNEQVINVTGDFFHCLVVPTGPILLRFDDGKQLSRFQAQGGRRYYSRVGVQSTIAQNVTLSLGFGYATDARISGNFSASFKPSTLLTDSPPIANTAAGQHTLVAANLNRLRFTVYSDPLNLGDAVIYFRKTGGANNIGFIVPGTYQEFAGVYGLDYQCTNGGDKLYITEES